jgi:hypothetical protein
MFSRYFVFHIFFTDFVTGVVTNFLMSTVKAVAAVVPEANGIGQIGFMGFWKYFRCIFRFRPRPRFLGAMISYSGLLVQDEEGASPRTLR